MGLLQPLNILYALSLLALVVIYLLAGHQPKLTVSSLMLFEQVPSRITKRRFRSDVFFWLEVAALSALSLAAAGLFFKLTPSLSRPKRWALVFDVGAGMGAREGSTHRIDIAKRRALALVSDARAGDEFSVVAYANEARTLMALSSDVATVRDAIGRLTVEDTVSRPAAFAAALNVARESDRVEIFAARLPPSAALVVRDVGARVEFNRVGLTQDNLAIVALEPGRPLVEPGYCVLRSFAGRALNCELAIDLDGRSVQRQQVTLEPRGQVVVPFGPLPAGGLVRASILGADALAADNVRYALAAAFTGERVLIMSAETSVSDDLARIVNSVAPGATVDTLQPNDLNSPHPQAPPAREHTAYNLLVAYDATPAKLPASATLAIFPRAGTAFRVEATATSSELERVSDSDALLAPVALGRARVLSVADWMKVRASGTTGRSLRLIPLAAIGHGARGRLGVIAFDIRAHLLFDPDRLDALTLTIDMLKDLLAPAGIRVVSTGVRVSVAAFGPAKLVAPDGSVTMLNPDPEQRVNFQPLLTGRYRVESGSSVESVFANYFDAAESDLTVAKESHREWQRTTEATVLSTAERVRPVSTLLAGLALLVFLVETALLMAQERRPGEAGE
jgi:hypothetical protein